MGKDKREKEMDTEKVKDTLLMKIAVASPRNIFMDFVTKNREVLGKSFECFSSDYFTTIGTDFYLRPVSVKVGNREIVVKAQIWHLSDNQRFSAVRAVYYKGTAAAVIAFSDIEKDNKRIKELIRDCIAHSQRDSISIALVYCGGSDVPAEAARVFAEGIIQTEISGKALSVGYHVLESELELESEWENQSKTIKKILEKQAENYIDSFVSP